MSPWFLKTSKSSEEHQHFFKAPVAPHLSMIVFPGTTERMNRMKTISEGGGKNPNKPGVECLYSVILYIQTWSWTEMLRDSKTSQDNPKKNERKTIQFHQEASKISFALSI